MHFNLVVILSCHVRKLRTTLIYVLVFLLVFFWTVPVAFASTLVSLQNLTKVAPFLKPGEILLFYQRLNPRITPYNGV